MSSVLVPTLFLHPSRGCILQNSPNGKHAEAFENHICIFEKNETTCADTSFGAAIKISQHFTKAINSLRQAHRRENPRAKVTTSVANLPQLTFGGQILL